MSSIRPEVRQQSSLHRENVKKQADAIECLRDLVTSCRGKHGRTKILQNQSGGHLTITSSSKRLLAAISIRNPIIQLLVTAAQGHLNDFGDGGLFLISFACDLVLKALDSGKSLKIFSELFEVFLVHSLEYLKSDNCMYKLEVSLSDMHFMCTYLQNVICTKPTCCLNDEQLQLLSKLLLECFIHTLPAFADRNCTQERVFLLCNDAVNVTETSVVPGLLVSAPEMTKFREIDLNLIKTEQNGMERVRIALITVSLSGDMGELDDVRYRVDDGIDVEASVVDTLLGFCDHLISAHVGLVLCQRVVHPRLKLRLRQAGVVLVDRLGTQPIKYVRKLTGASGVQALNIPVPDDMFGWVDSVKHRIVHGRSYLHLTKTDNSVCTLVLCHPQEEALQELKEVCVTALDSLDQLISSTYVLTGGGCWQTGLAAYLSCKITDVKAQLSDDHDCLVSMVMEACQLFTHSLQMAALSQHSQFVVNDNNGHLYHSNSRNSFSSWDIENPSSRVCCCKLGTSSADDHYSVVRCCRMFDTARVTSRVQQPVNLFNNFKVRREGIFDSFSMCMNAMQTAVLTVCSVLRIGQVIESSA